MQVRLISGLTPIFLIKDHFEVNDELEHIECGLDTEVAQRLLQKQNAVMLLFQELQEELFSYFELYLVEPESMEKH
jgi:hypothetical protein